MLPPAEDILTNHSPVVNDEVTRTPETTRTYLLVPVRACTLDRNQLSDHGHRVDGYDHLTSSSGI